MKNKITLIFILIFALSSWVQAKDVYDLPEVTPIINQLYPSVNEFSLKVSYFPIGAFNKHIGFGASYLRLDNPNHGWEVLSAYYFLEAPSSLKAAVVSSFGADPASFPVLKYLVKTGYTYVPFYSKSILFNSTLVHSRTYLNASAGVSDYQIEKPLLASIGFGQNFYFGTDYGVKLEVDYINFFKKSPYIQNQLTISVGMVFAWGGNE